MVRRMVFVLVLCWCALIADPVRAGGEAERVARRIQGFYEATHSFTADFEQEAHWRRGRRVRLSRGKVWFRKPGRMRWEYTWPEPLLVVSDGREVFVYSPRDRQVMVFPGSKALSPRVTLGFMSGRGNLLRDFVLEGAERVAPGVVALTVRPRERNAQVERLRLVAQEESGEIREIWFWDYLGNLTKIRFANLRRNVDLSDDLFRFEPPKGVEVIRERGDE